MKKTVQRSIVIVMTLMIILSFTAIFPVHAQPTPKLFVDPASIVGDTTSYPVSTTFTVDVCIANVTNLAGIQFELWWDPALLSGVSMEEVLFTENTPSGEETNIWALAHTVAPDHVRYAYGYMDLQRGIDNGYLPINVTTTTNPPDGKRIVATITLHVEDEPTKTEGFLETALEFNLEETYLSDMQGSAIECTLEDGYFKVSWAQPSINPYLYVAPSVYTATELGEQFDINIMIDNLKEGWELVGLEFKLGFNGTLLEALSVNNGTFFESFAGPPNGGVFYPSKQIFSDYVLVGVMVIPDENATWHSPYPNTDAGPGLVATITFNATYQEVFPPIPSLTCDLTLYDILGGDTHATDVPFGTPVGGTYVILSKTLGRTIDVYTQYPDPYGGQGLNQTSDLFWPQKMIHLFANVSYNEWPEQFKDVTFEVRDPTGGTLLILSDTTDEFGVAHVSFRIPWPEGEQWLCQEFTVVASVDIACEVVRDWLWFHFDYMVRWDDPCAVTTEFTEYKHCEEINITINFKSKAMQTYPVVITAVLKDELGYAWGFFDVALEVGGAEYCHYKNYTVELSIHVEKHVHAGIATVHVNALSGFPWDFGEVVYETYGYTWGYTLGSAWVPEYAPPPTVTIKAE
jgi:hypothetical protein